MNSDHETWLQEGVESDTPRRCECGAAWEWHEEAEPHGYAPNGCAHYRPPVSAGREREPETDPEFGDF